MVLIGFLSFHLSCNSFAAAVPFRYLFFRCWGEWNEHSFVLFASV